MSRLGPFYVLLPSGAWMATMETPPWAQASNAGPASVLGTLTLASIMGLPARWTAQVDMSCASVHLAMQGRHG